MKMEKASEPPQIKRILFKNGKATVLPAQGYNFVKKPTVEQPQAVQGYKFVAKPTAQKSPPAQREPLLESSGSEAN